MNIDEHIQIQEMAISTLNSWDNYNFITRRSVSQPTSKNTTRFWDLTTMPDKSVHLNHILSVITNSQTTMDWVIANLPHALRITWEKSFSYCYADPSRLRFTRAGLFLGLVENARAVWKSGIVCFWWELKGLRRTKQSQHVRSTWKDLPERNEDLKAFVCEYSHRSLYVIP